MYVCVCVCVPCLYNETILSTQSIWSSCLEDVVDVAMIHLRTERNSQAWRYLAWRYLAWRYLAWGYSVVVLATTTVVVLISFISADVSSVAWKVIPLPADGVAIGVAVDGILIVSFDSGSSSCTMFRFISMYWLSGSERCSILKSSAPRSAIALSRSKLALAIDGRKPLTRLSTDDGASLVGLDRSFGAGNVDVVAVCCCCVVVVDVGGDVETSNDAAVVVAGWISGTQCCQTHNYQHVMQYRWWRHTGMLEIQQSFGRFAHCTAGAMMTRQRRRKQTMKKRNTLAINITLPNHLHQSHHIDVEEAA
jgi:hypothetical protein